MPWWSWLLIGFGAGFFAFPLSWLGVMAIYYRLPDSAMNYKSKYEK